MSVESTTKSLVIQGVAPGNTSVTLTTTKDNAVSGSVTININVIAKEVLTISATTTEVNLIEGKSTTVEITYSGQSLEITSAPDSAIATVTLQD
mgnify:CR=1 FL=1